MSSDCEPDSVETFLAACFFFFSHFCETRLASCHTSCRVALTFVSGDADALLHTGGFEIPTGPNLFLVGKQRKIPTVRFLNRSLERKDRNLSYFRETNPDVLLSSILYTCRKCIRLRSDLSLCHSRIIHSFLFYFFFFFGQTVGFQFGALITPITLIN